MESKLNYAKTLFFADDSRFKQLIAGRRFGKTYLLRLIALYTALSKPYQSILFTEPTHDNARSLVFNELISTCNHVSNRLIKDYNKSMLEITFLNNSQLKCGGGHNYDRYRGQGYDLAIVDESSFQPHELWYEVLRPALSDRQGKGILATTPKGKANWNYDIYTDNTFNSHVYTTIQGELVNDAEIEEAKRNLNKKIFRQEYLATFEDYEALAYWAFSEENIAEYEFNPNAYTVMCWDFNVGEKPMSCVLNQWQGQDKWCFVQEFSYTHSNTEQMCNYIREYLDRNGFNGELTITGDYYGKRQSSNSSISDYQIIQNKFKNYLLNNKHINARPTRSIRDRVNAQNNILRSADGTIIQYVNKICKELIKDWQVVEFMPNGRELDGSNPRRTHMSDAASYFAMNWYPIRAGRQMPNVA